MLLNMLLLNDAIKSIYTNCEIVHVCTRNCGESQSEKAVNFL